MHAVQVYLSLSYFRRNQRMSHSICQKKKKRFTIESSFIEKAAHMYLKRAGSWENCNKDTND